jgi:DNA replication and repair protein RecF
VIVTHVTLQDFRSYTRAELDLDDGVTVLVGQNGVGKTNVVEALGYLSTQDSHRVAHDAPLIRFGAERAWIGARVVRGTQRTDVEVELIPGRANRARINRSNPQRARAALGILRSVLFSPEDLELVNGDPGARRRFIDDLVVQLRPDQAAVRSEYEKVLKQRNALLKSVRAAGGRFTDAHAATLDVWDEHLAVHGARMLRNRVHVLGLLAPHLRDSYASLTDGSKTATARYLSTCSGAGGALPALSDAVGPGPHAAPEFVGASDEDLKALLLQALGQARRRETERGLTLVGPHRDEVVLGLGPAPAKGFASHGESWSLALALRLASYAVLTEDDPSPASRPVLMLDDVFAELDARRRAALVSTVHDAQQVIVTAAVREDVPPELDARLVPVGPGWLGQEPGQDPAAAEEATAAGERSAGAGAQASDTGDEQAPDEGAPTPDGDERA